LAGPGKADLLSRQHFSLSCENGDYYIEDRGSTNGTRLNGSDVRGKGRQPLKDGDRFPMTLRFEKAGEREVMVWVQQPRDAAAASGHRH